MRVLLDTHAFLWWLDGDRRLSPRARRLIGRPPTEVFVSAASAWEIVIKASAGKLPGAVEVAGDVAGALASQGFRPLDVTIAHVQRSGGLPDVHRDPFDRILAAQSPVEGLPIVSSDEVFDGYGVRRVW